MELQSSRRRLGTQSPRGSPRSCRSGDDEEVDCISGLHDDLLIQILLRLHCAATAARTSALSRRWRESSLWRHLPVLSFRGIAPSALEAALAQVALPKLSLLDIAVPDLHPPSAEAVDSMLRSAARLNPVEFSFAIFWEHQISIEVPSFSSTTSISLNVNHPDGPDPTLLPVIELSGEFPALERLSITSGRLDTAGARCPQLRVLEFINCQGHDTMTVHSETVEELLVTDEWLLSIDIVAPLLKRFTLSGSRVLSYFEMSLLAPRVENLSWNCPSRWWIGPKSVIGIDELGMWHLYDLTLRTERGGFVLGLDIRRPPQGYTIDVRDLQEMFQFPKISALELCLCAHGHVYGAVVLQLLRVCNAVQRLKLRTWTTNEECPPNCCCDQPQDWRSQNISLMGLEEVEIEYFRGSDHEVDCLKLLFRWARLTKVIVKLVPYVVAHSKGCKEAYNIFMENPAVECRVYRTRRMGFHFVPYNWKQ